MLSDRVTGSALKQTVSVQSLVIVPPRRAQCGGNMFERCQNMSLVNYVLVGVLGALLALALYAAKFDMSGAEGPAPAGQADRMS